MELATIIPLLLFIGLLLAAGHFSGSNVNHGSDYLLAGKRTGLFALTATLVMTELNTSTLISFSSMGYLSGTKALLLPLVFLIGLSFYALVVAKKWKQYNGLSVAGFFSDRYGKDVGILATIILFSAMALFSATYVKSLSFIFAPLFPDLNPWVLSALLVVASLAMTLRAGLVSIIRTDVITFLAVCLFIPALWWLSSSAAPAMGEPLAQNPELLPEKFVLSLIILTMFTYILAPWYGQKIVSAENQTVAFKAVGLSAIIVFIIYGLALLATSNMAASGLTATTPEMSLPALINSLPPAVKGLGLGILFAISATTLTGVWSAMVTLLIGDSDQKNPSLKSSIKLTIVCSLISLTIANVFVDKVFSKLILANIPIAALSFALLAGFYWPKVSRAGVYLSITTGIAWGVGCYLHFGDEGLYTWYWAVYGIPLIFATGIIGSILLPDRRPAIEAV